MRTAKDMVDMVLKIRNAALAEIYQELDTITADDIMIQDISFAKVSIPVSNMDDGVWLLVNDALCRDGYSATYFETPPDDMSASRVVLKFSIDRMA